MSDFNKAPALKGVPGSAQAGQQDQRLFQKEYAAFLTQKGVSYSCLAPYLVIGGMPAGEGWLVHISVVRQQAEELMNAVLDFLIQSAFSFVIPAGSGQHSIILDGRNGLMRVGKVITVYIRSNEKVNLIASNLIELTEGLKGPAIPEAVHLGSCVYVSYGSIWSVPDLNANKFYSSIHGYNAAKALKENLVLHDLKWPFSQVTPLNKKQTSRLINRQYLLIQSLKQDPKGNVFKCIKLNRGFDMQWCVLKQGKQYQCFDHAGRDTKDRLRWQYHIHQLLVGKVPLPRVLDYFEDDADAYLALEYIEGISLNDKLINLQQGLTWQALAVEIRKEIIDYLLQVIEILAAFHRNDLVHRDVAPGNFLVTEAGKVIAIDIELCYHFVLGKPNPAFILGTEGYMPPQQIEEREPAVADDIYGLGGLLIKAFTGLSPHKLNVEMPDQLHRELSYFLGSESIVAVICACLSPARPLRPGIKSIRQSLEVYATLLSTVNGNKTRAAMHNPGPDEINRTVRMALNAFSLDLMLGANNEWVSKNRMDHVLANELSDYCWHPGFNWGTAGILFTLSLAKTLGYETIGNAEITFQNLNYLEKATGRFRSLQPGLAEGAYGMAITFKSLNNSEFIKDGYFNRTLIDELLSLPTAAINLANGMAGQGIAMLYCIDQLPYPPFSGQLSAIASALSDQQEKDGSWLLKEAAMAPKGIKLTGFYHGVAGIIYFLLEYALRFENPAVKKTIIQSLNWLIKQLKFVKGSALWSLSPKNQTIDPWLEHGFSGIALTFIKAFEVLKEPVYKEVASAVLLSHPKYIASNYLTLGNGLSGLGEIYLEAFNIFKETEWKERADHIAGYLTHACKWNTAGTCYWLEGNNTRPGADLMTGMSGIIHFLMRCNYPEKVGFPFLLNH